MKAAMAFPFHDRTKHLYRDEHRDLFPETQILSDSGLVQISTEEQLTIDSYCALPDKQRRHILKYGGGTMSGNDKGQLVFSLSRTTRKKCLALLKKAVEDFKTGEPWILQPDIGKKYAYEYLDNNDNILQGEGYAKFSGFYGASGLIAKRALFKNYYKVGGSGETVCAIME
jgi:hypothetical protein